MSFKRRDFIKSWSLVLGAAFIPKSSRAEGSSHLFESKDKEIPQRKLGKTGEKLSIIGLGGMTLKGMEPGHAHKVVGQAVERGINYFDVAPTYGDAELKMGPALKPFKREELFIACKTQERDQKGAEEELHRSLKRMETPYFDLYQLHAIADVEKDVKMALSSKGAIQTFIKAREQGLIKYLGFSAHSDEAALYAMRNFDFDTILYPVNFCCHFQGNFDQEVLKEAKNKKMGILAIKSLAKQRWGEKANREQYPKCWYEPVTDPYLGQKALNWTLSQGVTAAVPPSNENLFKLASILGPHVRNIDLAETEELKELSKSLMPIFSA
ncbi:MAG: aldo/keto reductase [Candidatus Aminicenantes bacterium]